MKLKNPSKFVVANMDVKNEDTIEFLNAGVYQPLPQDPSKETLVFNVKVPSGDSKMMSLNNTSQTNLMKVWGDESSSWIGKTAKVQIVEQMVFNKMKNVIYLTAVDAPAEKEIKEEEVPAVQEKEVKDVKKKKEKDEINVKDIPF